MRGKGVSYIFYREKPVVELSLQSGWLKKGHKWKREEGIDCLEDTNQLSNYAKDFVILTSNEHYNTKIIKTATLSLSVHTDT